MSKIYEQTKGVVTLLALLVCLTLTSCKAANPSLTAASRDDDDDNNSNTPVTASTKLNLSASGNTVLVPTNGGPTYRMRFTLGNISGERTNAGNANKIIPLSVGAGYGH